MPTKIRDLILYSVPEASQMLHVTTVSVRNYIRQGHLKGRKLTGRWFITEDELNKFVKKLQNNSPKQIEGMGENYEKEIKEIMAKVECPSDFACYTSDFKPRCEVKDVELNNHLEIEGECDYSCKYLVTSNGVRYCKCPLCVYLTKKFVN